jgi:polysaccharide biosynthesis protein VpsQ
MRRIKILTVIFALAFVLIIIFADWGKMPKFLASLYAFPNGDKVGHFLLVGLLAFLVNLSFSCRIVRFGSRNILVGSLVVAVVMTLEEISQGFFANRTASWLDLIASYGGILFFSWLAVSMFRKK